MGYTFSSISNFSGSLSAPSIVLSLEILVASDFDKVARTAMYYLQYFISSIIICNF